MDFGAGDVTRRDFMALLTAIASSDELLRGASLQPAHRFGNQLFQISLVGAQDCLWSYRLTASGSEYRIAPPVFNVDNRRVTAQLAGLTRSKEPARLSNGATEYAYEGAFAGLPSLSLTLLFRVAPDCPIVRFSYILKAAEEHTLTKPSGKDDLTYFGVSLAALPQVKEVRLSDFRQLEHSYTMDEVPLGANDFQDGLGVMGPIVVGSSGTSSFLAAYEHGSQVPDQYLRFDLSPGRSLELRAMKSNYLAGEAVNDKKPYQTLWFEIGAVNGDEHRMASAFRSFVLSSLAQNPGPRSPLVCYNTWHFQQRNAGWYGKSLLESINEDRTEAEIDVAHRMGIDVYVLDVGWFVKTGDWEVNLQRFPEGFSKIKSKLDRYGMKLGLWFGPTFAAESSRALRDYRDCLMTWRGKEAAPRRIFETESAYNLCLVSRYSDAFTERLIQLSKDLGVTYFKWDSVGQYGCDSPRHWHGGPSNTAEERAESHAFQLVRIMSHMVDRIAAACPDAIVDFDVTEAGRAFGLAFLSAGRYFLINNGPHDANLDIPPCGRDPQLATLFYKGPARTWICRMPLTFDKWVPSTLFLTHYLPDDPIESQEVNIASLVLGQNGIWGDLLRVSDGGVQFIGETLSRYKQVWNDVAASDPVVFGHVSGSPEIHEKISAKTGRGAVVVFATATGQYSYVTRHKVVPQFWASENVSLHRDGNGHARMDLDFKKPGAKIVFFGIE
jgi:alpha-galactosidase